MGVAAGNPMRFTTNVAVAEVMFPDESFVAFSVMVAMPPPAASVPVTAGTSSDGRSAAVNVCLALQERVLGVCVTPHAETTARDRTSANEDTYFILSTPVIESIVKRICD